MQQVCGGVVAHDVMAALHIHFGEGLVANFGLAGYHFADVDDDARGGFAHFGNFDFPAGLTPGSFPSSRRERADVAGIAHLSAGFDVEAGLGQHDFDCIAKGGRINRFPIHHQGQHFAFDGGAGIRVVFDAFRTELLVSLQGFQHTGVEFGIFAAQRAHGLAAAGRDAVLVHRGAEAGFVHIQVLFAGDVAGNFEGQTVGGIQVESLVSVEDSFLLTGEFIEQVL